MHHGRALGGVCPVPLLALSLSLHQYGLLHLGHTFGISGPRRLHVFPHLVHVSVLYSIPHLGHVPSNDSAGIRARIPQWEHSMSSLTPIVCPLLTALGSYASGHAGISGASGSSAPRSADLFGWYESMRGIRDRPPTLYGVL